LGIDSSAACSVSSLADWMNQKHAMQPLIQQHWAHAQLCMKHQADKNRTECAFSMGDWVYVKLQPYVQTYVAPRANQKLAFRFFGPYKIEERIGSVAYRLQLPTESVVVTTQKFLENKNHNYKFFLQITYVW
jgi:hypothetical protein